MFAFLTGIIALSLAVLLGGWRQFCIFVERREMRSHVPMAWYSARTRFGTGFVVVAGTLWAAYTASLITGSKDWISGAAFVSTIVLRWMLSASVGRIFLKRAVAGEF
jgi:hypothetical protein